jgi:hypothetical protein
MGKRIRSYFGGIRNRLTKTGIEMGKNNDKKTSFTDCA